VSVSDVDLAENVLRETEAIIAAVKPDQLHDPTPCSDYDVADLIHHLVGWARSFAARFTGDPLAEDPNEYRTGANPALEFHQAAEAIVGAYRSLSFEGQRSFRNSMFSPRLGLSINSWRSNSEAGKLNAWT
jgi:uncharacterized protein (TIGR03083 family)